MQKIKSLLYFDDFYNVNVEKNKNLINFGLKWLQVY